MTRTRLETLFEAEGWALPGTGRIAVFAPPFAVDLAPLPADRLDVIQPFRPEHDRLSAAGYRCLTEPESGYAAAVVFVPRSKPFARALVARAAAVTGGGPVIVDGQKTDGVESLLKLVRQRLAPATVVARAHGKLFVIASAGTLFSDWAEAPLAPATGFRTLPGIFSAEKVDPASALLAASLPDRLGPVVADLGAGWGYLAHHVLKAGGVETCHLVEADARALDCARGNVVDPRAVFHWDDVTRWHPPHPVDTVVMNPPFHAGARHAEPEIGRGFIAAAARALAPRGELWLVANRHLPYEAALEAGFTRWHEVAGDNRFKILHASQPSRQRRRQALG